MPTSPKDETLTEKKIMSREVSRSNERQVNRCKEIELLVNDMASSVLRSIADDKTDFMPTPDEVDSLKTEYEALGGNWNDEQFHRRAGLLHMENSQIVKIKSFFDEITSEFDDGQQQLLNKNSVASAKQIIEDLTTGDGYAQIIGPDGIAKRIRIVITNEPSHSISTVANGGMDELINNQPSNIALGNGLADIIKRGGMASYNNERVDHLAKIRESIGKTAVKQISLNPIMPDYLLSEQPTNAVDPGYSYDGKWVASTYLHAWRSLPKKTSKAEKKTNLTPSTQGSDSKTPSQVRSPERKNAFKPAKMSREALSSIFNSIQFRNGLEHGGILGSSDGGKTIDKFQKINQSPQVKRQPNASSGTWDPDIKQLNHFKNEIWSKQGVEIIGMIHSHPDTYTDLSQGDKAYITRIFESMPQKKILYFPVLAKERKSDDTPTLFLYEVDKEQINSDGEIILKYQLIHKYSSTDE